MDRPVRVMLVEDNSAVRTAIAALLNTAADLQVCAEAATVAESGAMAEATAPDVAVIDLRLPDGSGVEAGRAARRARPGIRVLLLTSASHDVALAASLLTGAAGFLAKQLLGLDVVGTVRAVAAGETRIDLTAATAALHRLDDLSDAPTDARIVALAAEGWSDLAISQDLAIDEAAVRARVAQIARRSARVGRGAEGAAGQVPNHHWRNPIRKP